MVVRGRELRSSKEALTRRRSSWLNARTAPILAAPLATILAPSPVLAYRTLATAEGLPDGVPLRWTSEVRVQFASDPPPGLTEADVDRAIIDALGLWTATECDTPPAIYLGRGSPSSGDGVVSIRFVRSGWEAAGLDVDAPATTEVLYELDAAGTEARLVDADVLINSEHFTWGSHGSDPHAIFPTLAHELGHAFGTLGHPCTTSGEPGVPSCASFAEPALMHPLYMPEVQDRLHPDDLAGLCAVYGTRGPACDPECGIEDTCDGGVCVPRECVGAECTPCSTDADCAPLGFCDGVCLEPFGPGEPCDRDAACSTGLCVASECAAACTPESCGLDRFCASPGGCEPIPSDFGAACERPADCASARCVEGDRTGTFCTVECHAASECPGTFVCRDVEGIDVCVPPPPASCAAIPRSATFQSNPVLSLLLALGAIVRRASRRSSR